MTTDQPTSQLASQPSVTVSVTSEIDDNVIVINELLAYICHHQKHTNNASLISAVFNFYTSDEVIEAKKLATKTFTGADARNRRDCKSYNGKMENISDILKVVKDQDSSPSVNVVFAAVNLSRMPSYSPEETCPINMVHDVASLKAEMRAMKEDFACMSTDFDRFKQGRSWTSVVKETSSPYPRPPDDRSPTAVAPAPRPSDDRPPTAVAPALRPSDDRPPTALAPAPRPSDQLPASTSRGLHPHTHSPLRPPTNTEADDDVFMIPKQHAKKALRQNRHSRSVCGSREVAGGVVRKAALFVFNCDASCDVDWLRQHMECVDAMSGKQCVTPFNVWAIKPKHVNLRTTCYKVIINAVNVDSVFESGFWPANVRMRMWNKKNPEKTHTCIYA